ncbi:MAG: cysteine desulfurase [Bacteroidetes bacterium]|nr:MAG: cysteine desulfurase [Bacteroidota bacterium]
MQVYLDNAATTPIDPEVFESMTPYLTEFYGNPSSAHANGRKARAAIEYARKTIAKLIGVSSAEIIFTSGGTESNNIFLQGVAPYVEHIISSPIEHPAVLQTINYLAEQKKISVSWLTPDASGQWELGQLEKEIVKHPKAIIALMHGNNEVGNLLPLEETSTLCQKYNVPFFTDAVQTIGHYAIDVSKINVAGLSASAHKFHGPKGVGFLYLKSGTKLSSLYKGGEQERTVRPGTENVAGIVGMAKAMELSYNNLEEDRQHIEGLKNTLKEQLVESIPGIQFNGSSADPSSSNYTILSASIPEHEQNSMLIFNLDLENIYVSAGSACASGANTESHVLKALGHDSKRATIRFSFSRRNTMDEIKFVAEKLRAIYSAN